MRYLILIFITATATSKTFAQKTVADTVDNNDALNTKCAENLANVIAKKDYSAHTFVLQPNLANANKAVQENPQLTEVVIQNYPPVLKKGEVLYHVVEVKKTIVYPMMNYSLENFNILLYDAQLKPLFISIRYTSDTSSNFSFTGVYQNQYLEFSDGKGKHFYVSPPNTNPDPSANYLEIKNKRMCFYEIPEDQVKVSIAQIRLPLQHKYVFCSEAYGVKNSADH